MEQRSEEWFEARKGRITGSAVGAILELSPFATSEDVMRRMVRDYYGQESEFKGNIATEYGEMNEPNAIADYEMNTGIKVQSCGFYTHQDWLGASPDGLIGNDGLLEVKCPFSLRHGGDFKYIHEQMHYYAQMQIQMYVTGRQWCDFYQWSAYGDKLERVNYDPQWIELNLPILESFYELYLVAINPENAWRYLDGGELVQKYQQAIAALEVAKSDVEDAKQALIDATNGEGGQIGSLKITKVSKKGSVSYAKAIKDLAPDADLELYRGKNTEYWKIS